MSARRLVKPAMAFRNIRCPLKRPARNCQTASALIMRQRNDAAQWRAAQNSRGSLAKVGGFEAFMSGDGSRIGGFVRSWLLRRPTGPYRVHHRIRT
jgi:hypothetical protein